MIRPAYVQTIPGPKISRFQLIARGAEAQAHAEAQAEAEAEAEADAEFKKRKNRPL